MQLPIPENWISFAGVFALTITLLYLTWLFGSRFFDLLFAKKDKDNNKKRKYDYSCFGCLIKLVFLTALFWFGVSMLTIATMTHSYNRFTEQKLVAEVLCEPIDSRGYDMQFSITQRYGLESGQTRTYYLKGEKWFLEGEILKWRNWATFLGLSSMYRLSKVGATYWQTKDRLSNPQSIQDIASDKLPPRWSWLHKYGYKLPIIQDVFTDTISKAPARGKKFNIYVTSSGFTVETINIH